MLSAWVAYALVCGVARSSHRTTTSAVVCCASDPPRVRSDSTISVRKQIKLARFFKELESRDAQRAKTKTRFRKAKSESRGPGSDDEVDPGKPWLPTYLLVDGYNVVGKTTDLGHQRDGGSLAKARSALLRRLEEYVAYMDWKCVLVWDAAGNEHNDGDVVEEEAAVGVSVVFSATCADTYIAEEAKLLIAEGRAGSVFVATSDHALQNTVQVGNAAAHIISASQLVTQLQSLRSSVRKEIKRANEIEASNFGAFTHLLDSRSLSALRKIETELDDGKPVKSTGRRRLH